MSSSDARKALAEAMGLTLDHELDCEEFLAKLAEYVDGASREDVCKLMQHHRALCTECEEEHQILRRALGLDDEC